MMKALLAGAAVSLALAAGTALANPAFAQATTKSPGAPLSMGPVAQQPMMQQTPILQPPMQQTPTLQPPIQQVVPDEPVTPAQRAQVRRDWDAMAREWEQRQRSGAAPSQGSVGTPAAGGAYGGYGSDVRIAPAQPSARSTMPMRGSGMQGLPQEATTATERAQVHRDWNEMAREWEQRQRSGIAPPAGTGQPPLPTQR